MKKTITVATLSVILSACGGSGSAGLGEPGLGEPDLGAAEASPSMVNTADLKVDADFDFASSRNIDIEFDIADAAGSDASVSICTDYNPGGGAFDVNYESCTVTGEMYDGKFSHAMDVTNEFDSVVAVVWFQDSSSEPLYKEFFVETSTRSKGGKPALIWQ